MDIDFKINTGTFPGPQASSLVAEQHLKIPPQASSLVAEQDWYITTCHITITDDL